MAENCGVACCPTIGDPLRDNVGGPLQNTKIKLQKANNEICIYGSSVMQSYFKNSEQTSKTIKDGRWLHTGDIGKV